MSAILNSETVVVQLDEVGVRYSNGFQALLNVNLQVYQGDFLGLIGPNGSGKTTMISTILGLVKPTIGSVKLFGEPLNRKNLRRVGYVPQKTILSDSIFPSTVFETVLMGRVVHAGLLHRYRRADYQKVEDELEHLSINDLRDRKIGELSGGQSQRVLLAKALASDPKLLILDEPTSGVDTRSSAEFYDTLEHLNRDHGITVMLVSHDIGLITKLSNRVACLNGGVCFQGSTHDLLSDPSVLADVYGRPVELVKHGHG
jgi:zinc transport system ATP-binding protein